MADAEAANASAAGSDPEGKTSEPKANGVPEPEAAEATNQPMETEAVPAKPVVMTPAPGLILLPYPFNPVYALTLRICHQMPGYNRSLPFEHVWSKHYLHSRQESTADLTLIWTKLYGNGEVRAGLMSILTMCRKRSRRS